MTRDYKSPSKKKSNGKGSPLFVGLLIGLLIGVIATVALIIYIKASGSPFAEDTKTSESEPVADKKSAANDVKPQAPKKTEANSKPRFDFYTILPGSETAVSEQEIKKNEQQADAAKTKETYYLQVGAFQTEQEADNMKAKLALLGLESVIQTATLPEKGIWHRVRVGPFSDSTQIEKAKADLTQNGFKSDLIKVKTDASHP